MQSVVGINAMATPTQDMVLYQEQVTQGREYWDQNQKQWTRDTIRTVEADEYLCRQFRGALAGALAVQPGMVSDEIETLALELMDVPGNSNTEIEELLRRVSDVNTFARGGIVDGQDIHTSATITIGNLCEILGKLKTGEATGTIARIREILEEKMGIREIFGV